MGYAGEVKTPKGLFATGEVGLHLSYYIGNYKGGRNESFMYGCDEKFFGLITIWLTPTRLVWPTWLCLITN